MTHNALKNGENSAIKNIFIHLKKKDIQRTLKLYSKNTLKIALFLHSRTQTNQILERKATLLIIHEITLTYCSTK